MYGQKLSIGKWARHYAVHMWLSTRSTFRKGDSGWDEYIAFIEIQSLTEVRTIDTSLNEMVDDSAAWPVDASGIAATLKQLPAASKTSYYQLGINLTEERLREGEGNWILLGFDLSDETWTSSILNCGPWKGQLAQFLPRLNQFGLLTYENALSAQKVLLEEWGDEEPHAHADIWQLYEISPNS